MKRNAICLACLLLLGAALFSACGEEDALTASGNDENLFIPDENDHSAVAELRRSFFEETGIYLLFSDTLRHVQSGTNAYGQTTYDTQLVDFNYNLTGDNIYTLRMEYYTTLEEMQQAVQIFKDFYLPHMGDSMKSYSILLLKNLEEDDYGSWVYRASVSNIYCMGIGMGDVGNLTEEEIATTANDVFKEMVDNVISNYDWDDYQGPFYDLPGDNTSLTMGELIPGWDRTQLEELYQLGFIDYIEDYAGDPYYDEPWYQWDDYFELVMDNSWDELEAEWGKYSLIMQELELVREAVLSTGYVF